MENRLYSLSKIFTERIFRIPDFQRGYAWTEKQLREFWGDLMQLEINKNHYIGVLTLEEVSESEYKKWEDDLWIINSKCYVPYHVVDGQQRLTTAIVLIQCIIESIEPGGELNYTSADSIRNRFIFETKDAGISRSYLFGYEKYNPSYEFLKTRIFLESSDDSVLHETIYTSNLEFAKKFFIGKLKELKFEEVEVLYKKLTQHFLFNLYSMSNDIDVHVTFETMNNRGKPLSHLELLKNRLIYLSTKFPADDTEKAKLRRAINECWKTIYHYLGKNKENPLDDDTFLKTHFNVFHREKVSDAREEYLMTFGREVRNSHVMFFENPVHQWYLLERKFITKNVKEGNLTLKETYDYINNLKESVKIWSDILNPQESKFPDDEKTWLEKLNRLGFINLDSISEILLYFYENNSAKKQHLALLKSIEKLLFIREYLGRNLKRRMVLIHELKLHRLGNPRYRNFLPEIIEKRLNELKDSSEILIEELTEFFGRRKGFYKWDGIRYFLFEYELSLKEQSKTSREKLNWNLLCTENNDDYYTVEHIYPQTDSVDYWKQRFKQYTDIQKETLKNSLGNLVPLSKQKNSSLQNISFDDKKNKEKDYVGFRFGSYSENEVAEYEEWTAKEILQRGIKLLDFMEIRWNINLGDKTDKIQILNLEFVLKKEDLAIDEV